MAPKHTRTERRRRIWSETLDYDALGSAEVTALLRRYELDVLVAVTPELLDGAPRVLSRLADAGVRAAVWPMLDDASGRWASSATLVKYVAFVDSLTRELERARVPVGEVAFDLEPPFSAARAASHGALLEPLRAAMALRKDFAEAALSLASHVKRLGEHATVSCAAVPLVLLDEGANRPFFQALLGTPVDGVPFGSVSVMAYTTIVEGWSGGLVDRRSAVGVLAECARLARVRYAGRASLSLGTVGTGAFHDEPIYRGPEELAEDVATARAFGVDDLTLFDLGGVLRRGPPEAWLGAFVEDADIPRTLPRRVKLGSACLRALSRFR